MRQLTLGWVRTLTLTPFAPVPRAWQQELRVEGDRLVRFVENDATSFAVRFAAP